MGANWLGRFHETSADAPWARPYQMDCAPGTRNSVPSPYLIPYPAMIVANSLEL